MLFKRTAFAIALAAALLAVAPVAPAVPAVSVDPGVVEVHGYDWGYFAMNGWGFNIASGAACWGLGMYFSYIAFCPACIGAAGFGTAGCLLGAWA